MAFTVDDLFALSKKIGELRDDKRGAGDSGLLFAGDRSLGVKRALVDSPRKGKRVSAGSGGGGGSNPALTFASRMKPESAVLLQVFEKSLAAKPKAPPEPVARSPPPPQPQPPQRRSSFAVPDPRKPAAVPNDKLLAQLRTEVDDPMREEADSFDDVADSLVYLWRASEFAEARARNTHFVPGYAQRFDMLDSSHKAALTLIFSGGFAQARARPSSFAKMPTALAGQLYFKLSVLTDRYVATSPVRALYLRLLASGEVRGERPFRDYSLTPVLKVLPSTELFTPRAFVSGSEIPIGKFAAFERTRFELLDSHFLFRSSPAWAAWSSSYNIVGTCALVYVNPAAAHAQLVRRPPTRLAQVVNAAWFEPPTEGTLCVETGATIYCTCAESAVIVLCSDSTHMHCIAADADLALDQRRTATLPFGRASRERWSLLRRVSSLLPIGVHGSELFDKFEAAVRNDVDVRPLADCIVAFSGRAGPRTVPARSADPWLDSFDASNPLHVTLALQLFVWSNPTVAWRKVWHVWRANVELHCRFCPTCFYALENSLWQLLLFNAMAPVLPFAMAYAVEVFAEGLAYSP